MGPFELDRGGLIDEEVVAGEAGIALPALRVQDPEDRPSPGRPIAVTGDQGLRPLADDVPTEPDPRPPGQLEPDAGRLGDRGGQTTGGTTDGSAGRTGRLQDDEERLRSTGQCGQSAESIRDASRPVRGGESTARQIEDQQVHRTTGQQRATDGQTLVQRHRRDDDEPLETDTPGDRFDRIEAAREVQPGHDRPLRLGFSGHSHDEGRPATRPVAADGDTCRSGETAGPEDRVECREPGMDDAIASRREREEWRGDRGRPRGRVHRGRQSQCPVRDPRTSCDPRTTRDPRSCRSPASLEARHGCRHVLGRGRHRMVKIEHLFDEIKGAGAATWPAPQLGRRRNLADAATWPAPLTLATAATWPAPQLGRRRAANLAEYSLLDRYGHFPRSD